MTLTIERLKELMHYDPATGQFVRLVRCGKCKVGSVAGTLQACGYRSIVIDYKQYYAHRLAVFYMTGAWPSDEVDHRNVTPGEDQWNNLRPATRAQNEANKPLSVANTSGFKGICFDARRGKWAAYIKRGGKGKFLGYFTAPNAAHEAHMFAARQMSGDFARAA